MKHYLSIIRPVNGIMSAIAVYIAAVVAGSTIVPNFIVLMGMLVVFLINSGGMIVNDIFDADIDKINKPKRPIPSGKIRKTSAWIYAVVLFIVGNFLAYHYISQTAFYIALLATFLLCAYAAKLKQIMIAGHLTISLLVGLTFIYGGLIMGNYYSVVVLALLAFLSNVGREIYKTIEDTLGDRQEHVTTLPIKYGVPKAKLIGNIFTVAAVGLSFVPYFLQTFHEVYLFFVVIADIAFIAGTATPARISSKLSKIAMIIALIAFLAGAYSLRI
ncbi:MAG: UbiA family prenyltransferase [Candidatus Aenigmarchaeota archaeon]|nr:UbiA family prenyltransferase [Candidatus Aenigmarchaeota archaeon]